MKKMTEKSLLEAFAGESQAHMKYLAFADAARKEGYGEIARLFDAIAYAERVHATNHAKALGLIKKTAENLAAAIEGENFEVEEMYPAYEAIAERQKQKRALTSIHYAIEAEKIHRTMYRDAAKRVAKEKDIAGKEVYVCPVCGFTHIGTPPDTCPVCNVKKEKFEVF